MGIIANKLKGFVNKQHQPYTEYNQEIINWLEENVDGMTEPLGYNRFIFTQNYDTDSFYTYMDIYHHDVYYTNEQFKEWIGMTTKENLTEFPTLEAGKHIVRIGNEKWGYYLDNDVVAWVNYGGQSGMGYDRYPDVADEITHVYSVQYDTLPSIEYSKRIWDATKVKSDNIRKELQFAEAKKERLEKHIEVLKSKLQ